MRDLSSNARLHDVSASNSTPSGAPQRPGIVCSSRPQGWLGKRWLLGLNTLGARHRSRIARGRTFARGGRVVDLWFSPGLVTAEVMDGEPHRVSIRVRVFEDIEWNTVVASLMEDLRGVAKLMEGTLPPSLVQHLESEGVGLLPRMDDLDGDCDCADYMLPCVHMSAVHYLLADALDGDPFLLFTLRGWHRDRMLNRLRKEWGDTTSSRSAHRASEEAPPERDWFIAGDLGPMMFDLGEPEGAPLGLRALGPAPDESDLERALGPLYDAGAEAAHRPFSEDDATDLLDKRRRALENRGRAVLRTDEDLDDDDPGRAFTERLVDLLAEKESARSNELASALDTTVVEVRTELLELEELGLVYRTGQTRGTRWWIG